MEINDWKLIAWVNIANGVTSKKVKYEKHFKMSWKRFFGSLVLQVNSSSQ